LGFSNITWPCLALGFSYKIFEYLLVPFKHRRDHARQHDSAKVPYAQILTACFACVFSLYRCALKVSEYVRHGIVLLGHDQVLLQKMVVLMVASVIKSSDLCSRCQ